MNCVVGIHMQRTGTRM